MAPANEADRRALHAEMDRKEIDGFVWLTPSADGKEQVTYVSRSAGDFGTNDRVDKAVNHALVEHRLVAKGIPAAQVLR